MFDITIRTILPDDDAPLARIIREALVEHKANKPGTVYYDPTTDHLTKVFEAQGSIYYVALENGNLVGGCGIYPTAQLPEGYCEMVKLYLLPEARNRGIGKRLMLKCFDFALEAGYQNIYLETMPELSSAVSLYENLGFRHINAPMGASGHFGCDIWMVKQLV